MFFPHDNKPEHFKALDGLRGLAVLFVLLSHSSNSELYFHEYLNFSRIGKTGVYLFFVLSAYLLDRQIALAYLTHKSSKSYWKNYLLRRFLRIYPLFVISLVVHGILNWIGLTTVIDSIEDVYLHLIMVKGESMFWSIPVEFKYYFISPLMLWFCHRFLKWHKQKMLILFILVLFGSVLLEYLFRFEITSTLRYFPIFLVGTFLSIYELLFRDKMKSYISPKQYNWIGLLALLLIITTTPYYFNQFFPVEVNFQNAAFYFPYAFLWGFILLAAKYGKGFIQTLLELKFLRYIGTISFSLYLFHIPFLKMAVHLDFPDGIRIYLFFFCSLVFSSLSYVFIERPLSKIRIKTQAITEKGMDEKTS